MPITLTPIPPVTTTPLAKWSVVTPPAARPVVYADLKGHLRLDDDTDQTYVELLIDAATDYAQDALGMSLMPQTLAAVFNAEDVGLTPPIRESPDPFAAAGQWPLASQPGGFGMGNRAIALKLYRGPVVSVVSVKDPNGADVAGWRLERTPAGDRLRLNAPSAFPIIVTYTAGYPSAAAIPAGIRVAIMAHVGTLYANRESVAPGTLLAVPHNLEAFYKLKSRQIPVG